MGLHSARRALGALAGAALLAGAGTTLTAAPAAAAAPVPPGIPPLDCGMVHHEVGLLSSFVHNQVEYALLWNGLKAYQLANSVHGLNCTVVINLEYLTGLQVRPRF